MAASPKAGQSNELTPEESDLTWFYGGVDDQKSFSDYEWDPAYPGTLKPGLRSEMYDIDAVMEMWKDKPNDNVMRLHMDEVGAAPPAPCAAARRRAVRPLVAGLPCRSPGFLCL